VSGVGRVAAIGAIIAAVALLAIVLFGGFSNDYTVTARFLNAGQLVKGNPVQTGGAPIGSVQEIKITDNGEAQVKLKIDGDRAPLRQGTKAAIRQYSLSGIANRYVDLTMPPNGGSEIADGGQIAIDKTTTAVDLDELFNTLDPKTRKALQGFFKNQARQFHNRGEEFRVGVHYLNPALATSSRLFNELSKDTPVLERFLVDSAGLVTTLADRRDQLAALIGNLNDTTRALGNQKAALAESIGRLPPFMRRANTTFVNLRSALNDVDPLVNASKPVAKDLINLITSVPALADIALAKKNRTVSPGGHAVSVGNVRGAFPETVDAFKGGAKEIGFARPYTPDFLGWFDDFSTTGGGYDALGAYARGQIGFQESVFNKIPGLAAVRTQEYKNCPGSAEAPAPDGSNVLSAEEQAALNCSESARGVKR
jgi:phospholipid/cholesterol/gamma-HCH transport system substrate-binding protein